MSTQSSSSTPQQRKLLTVAGGCAVLALCLCVAGLAGAGVYYYVNSRAQTTADQPTVEYILDASPRMDLAAEGGTRLEVAQAVLAEIVRPADTSVTSGLRVFGNGAAPEACKDTNLIVPLARANQPQIADELLAVDAGASADAALAEAMIAAIRDLAATGGPHTLVVVTGGADACNAQAGELIKQEAERAGIKLQQFVIGFMVDEAEAQAIKAMIEESGAGAEAYFNAPDLDTLRNLLLTIQNFVDHPSQVAQQLITTAATPGAVIVLPTAVAQATPGGDGGPIIIGGETSEAGTTPEPGSDYPSQSACDHPYFPMRPGATWTYSSSEGSGYTWTVNSVSGDLSNATASVTISFETGSITYDWACTPEGITYFTNASVAVEGATFDYTISNQSG
ncbi:MAG TPA: hypothetical protein VJ020_11520, partial [Anaerolineales bacterium]|nr:hypothetical protein [Anaerolineales bacterium]